MIIFLVNWDDVVTLPWKIKNANYLQIFSTYGRKCKHIALLSPLPLLFIHKYFKRFTLYRLQIKFSMSLFFYLFTFAINIWHQKFVTADVTAVFVNNQHGIQ